ncbi:MAG: glycosyltransferase [Clostridia bacterium]|nr:glycosyltransferase [Clostridia bacterium]
MDQVKVSVIVPIYQVEKYLRDCLDSLVHQSLSDLEIIAVNDGSPDSCGSILEEYQKRFPQRLRVFEKENGGLSDARNFGLDRAAGKYVAFLDGDDFVDLDLYERLYRCAEETEADCAACDICYEFPDQSQKIISCGIPSLCEGKGLKRVFCRFYPAVWNKIYRRELLLSCGVRFQKGITFEDVEFSHRLFPYFRRLASVPLTYIHYVQREGSITARPDERLFDYVKNFNTVYDFFRERNLLSRWEKELEYVSCRYLLATFLKRASYLEDALYEMALKESLEFLDQRFPHRRRNPYFWKNGAKGLYLLFFTPALSRTLRKGVYR